MTANNYACANNLWAHCGALGGALGDALRRASEAEAEVAHLRAHTPVDAPSIVATAYQRMIESVPHPPQLSGCPKCGSDASTVRGLRKEETEAGLRVCSRCFTRYER